MSHGPLVIEICVDGEEDLETATQDVLPAAVNVLFRRQRPTVLALGEFAGEPFIMADGTRMTYFKAVFSYRSMVADTWQVFREQVVTLLDHMIEDQGPQLMYTFEPAAMLTRPSRLGIGSMPPLVHVMFRCISRSESVVREQLEALRRWIDENLHEVEHWFVLAGEDDLLG